MSVKQIHTVMEIIWTQVTDVVMQRLDCVSNYPSEILMSMFYQLLAYLMSVESMYEGQDFCLALPVGCSVNFLVGFCLELRHNTCPNKHSRSHYRRREGDFCESDSIWMMDIQPRF